MCLLANLGRKQEGILGSHTLLYVIHEPNKILHSSPFTYLKGAKGLSLLRNPIIIKDGQAIKV